MRLRLLLATLALAQSTAWGQTDTSGGSAAEPPVYYQVELVVFRHLDQSTTTGEIPRMPETEMTDLLDQDLARLAAEPGTRIVLTDPLAEPDGLERANTRSPRVVPANANKLLLAGTAERLKKLQVYDVVSYLRWGQQAADVTVAEELDMAVLGADPRVLSGVIELHQRRYLHLALEITLEDSGSASLGYAGTQEIPRGSAALPVIKDSRRVRLEELQYFDQPNFGVLAIVSRMDTQG